MSGDQTYPCEKCQAPLRWDAEASLWQCDACGNSVVAKKKPVKGAWSYHIEESQVVERWSTKRQQKELQIFQQRLNELGERGWEMIGFESVPLLGGITKQQKGYAYLTFFKRQA